MTTERDMTDEACPSRDRVLESVKRIVAEQMGLVPETIREHDALINDLGCDSLDVVEITMEVEDHFDICVSDEMQEKIRTIGDVTGGVLQLLGEPVPD